MDVTFEDFVVARGPSLVRFTHALCGDRQLAEDLVQEVLVKTHRRWDKIHGRPEPYVRSALVRELVSWRRRRSHHEIPGPVPERAVEDTAFATHDAMWREIATLPVRQRAVLVLRYWEGLSDAEIAALLNCAESTVRSSAARAFAVLRTRPDLPEGAPS